MKEDGGNGKDTNPPKKSVSFMSYLKDELRRDYMLQFNEKKLKERRKRVYTFVKTPKELEKFLLFGFWLCLDVFLFVFTFLPVRLTLACLTALKRIITCSSGPILEPVHKIDLLKGVILVVVSSALLYVDTSVIYHVVRVQSVIKLYVVYNMLDIADKLLSSFGQDVLDALFWTAAEPRGRKREHVGIIPHLLLSLVYVAIHAMIHLAQSIVLNVALNSFNKALLTIMISNQFIEIKSSVFKKFEKNNLFQVCCSDARERFHYLILLLIVAIRNLAEYDWNIEYAYNYFAPFAAVVVGSEFIVDWFKHAFITKFNNIKPEVYTTYRTFLARNLLYNKIDTVFCGHTDQVSRRMGFTVLPMAVLLIRISSQSISLHGVSGFCFAVLAYISLCSLKFLVSIHIVGKATEYVKDNQRSTLNEPSWSFAPLHSVQDIHPTFSSDIKIFAASSTQM